MSVQQTNPPLLHWRVQDFEINRIMQTFKLDAYAILDIQPGLPEKDIKAIYRRKSLLIHPDKTRNVNAAEAFDRLKKAQEVLMDEKRRGWLDECISDARGLVLREKKEEEGSEEFLKVWRRRTVEVIVEAEARRRRAMKVQMAEEGRERAREEEEGEERKRKREREKKWEDTREERIGSWRDFQKGESKKAEGKKKKKLKVIG